MKILRLRGENLASLREPFDLDFRHGPLGDAGLFAIVGPTGAGKSTLLDAICLCLFDRTPRLSDRAGATIRAPDQDAEQALAANDARNILRRGAAQGWAELEFRDGQGRRFTSRWEVRRARGRAQGKVQAQQLSLRDEQGQLLGGTKTETLTLIEQLIGLDFEQFRRSVLLAQGDFAAFLKANEAERARLLEQMTGTAIFGRLSMAAFRRSRELEAARENLRARQGEHRPLGEEERAALQAEEAALAEERRQVDGARQAAEAALRWHDEDARLAEALRSGEAELDGARRAWEEASPRRRHLERAERAWELRGGLAQATRAAQQAQVARAERERTQAALGEAHREADRTGRALIEARARLAGWRLALLEQVQGRHAAAEQAAAAERAWLEANPDHAALAEPRHLDALLARVGARLDAEAAQEQARAQVEQATTSQEQRRRARETAQQQAAAQGEREAAARAQVDLARAEAGRFDDEALFRLGRELAEEGRRMDERAAELDRLRELELDTATERRRAEELRDGLAQAQSDAELHRRALTELLPRLEECEEGLRLARQAQDAESLRAGLRPGEPCPVCGSPEHPWAVGSPLASMVQALTERRADLERARRELEQAQAEALARAKGSQQALEAASSRAATLQARLDEARRDWREKASALHPALAEGGAEALATLRQQHAARRAAHEEEGRQAAQARKQLEGARRQLDLQAQLLRKVEDALAQARQQEHEGERALTQARTLLDERERRAAELEQALRQALAPLPAPLPSTPLAALPAALQALAAEARQHVDREARARLVGQSLAARLPMDRERAEQACRALPEGGAPLAPAVAPEPNPARRTDLLESGVEQAQAELGRLEEEAHRQQAELTRLGTALAEAEARAALREQEAREQAEALQRRARELGESELDWLQALPEGWRETERAALAAIQTRLDGARVRQEERKARLDAHQGQAPPQDRAAAALALAQAQERDQGLAASLAHLAGRLQADELARAQLAALDEELERHDLLAGPWHLLNASIGQANGDKFKRFAQSLSLEALLLDANQHLRGLARRYALERVPGTDLDLQVVDRDMGEERRAVQSLSGGESFLVSLALALGLASLNSRGVRLESLFIDEGFGTLDPQSLEQALSVLEALQAEGRQVGIISHVGGLEERISARVQLVPLGGGRSRLQVVGGT